jgi:hypothetical protein
MLAGDASQSGQTVISTESKPVFAIKSIVASVFNRFAPYVLNPRSITEPLFTSSARTPRDGNSTLAAPDETEIAECERKVRRDCSIFKFLIHVKIPGSKRRLVECAQMKDEFPLDLKPSVVCQNYFILDASIYVKYQVALTDNV